ncbi:MAG: pirin family protein [Alphaproteobacteria bacterium]|nr:pirin family protein [Alphaproteobacteria bacterium]
MSGKTFIAQHKAIRDDIGDLTTRRPVPGPAVQQVDPFLFLNHHGPQTYPPNNTGLPFGPHPHRGFETVTFILEGGLMHRDTGGHESIIHAGGVQWMTAGSGLIHSELSPDDFKRNGGPLEILQLWVNLPAQLKMSPPCYTGLQRNQIPVIASDDGRVTLNLVAGAWNGHEGPIESLTGIFASTVGMKAGGRLRLEAVGGRNVFLYVVRGSVRVEGVQMQAYMLAELSRQGETVDIESVTDAVLLLCHGDPIGEPVAAHGPFVMNTVQEIHDAIRDYQAGKFNAPAA